MTVVNGISNISFGAKIRGPLMKEMNERRREAKKRGIGLGYLDEEIERIRQTAPNAIVNLSPSKENYSVKMGNIEYIFPRCDDANGTFYKTLIRRLDAFDHKNQNN